MRRTDNYRFPLGVKLVFKRCLIILLILIFVFIWPVYANTPQEQPATASDFSLLDQYGKSYNIAYPQDKICVLVFADRSGVSQVEGWVRPLYEVYQDTILIHGVAQLKAVPKWLRGMLRGIFKKTVKFSVMMDWTGEVCRAYGYPGGKAFVVIVDRQGIIRHTVNGEATDPLLDECRKIIDDLKPVLLQSALP